MLATLSSTSLTTGDTLPSTRYYRCVLSYFFDIDSSINDLGRKSGGLNSFGSGTTAEHRRGQHDGDEGERKQVTIGYCRLE